jgi:hypothetical protein
MADESKQQLLMRWEYQCKQLAAFIKAGNHPMVDATRGRVNAIANQAEEAKVKLTRPEAVKGAELAVSDPVFEGLEGLMDEPAETVGEPFIAQTTAAAAVQAAEPPAPSIPRRARKKAEQPLAEATAQPAAPAEAPQAANPEPLLGSPHAAEDVKLCAHGCGVPIKAHQTFAQGHASKYHSLIRQVETGQLKAAELPAQMRDDLKWGPDGLATNPLIEIRRNVGGGRKPSPRSTNGAASTNPAIDPTPNPAPMSIAERLAYHQAEIAKLTPVHEAMQRELSQLHAKYEKVLASGGPKRTRRSRRKPTANPGTLAQPAAAPPVAAPAKLA